MSPKEYLFAKNKKKVIVVIPKGGEKRPEGAHVQKPTINTIYSDWFKKFHKKGK